MSKTIYAVSSAKGRGGVAVIRVSGPDALAGLYKLTGLTEIIPRQAVLSKLRHPESANKIDQAVVLYFQAPASYTGEDIVEYHVHGGRAVIASVIEALGRFENYHIAEPGEFTKRAFENGKMDLTEAEAVADLINAETEAQKQQALSQLSGSLHRLYERWADALKKLLAHQEADIEFPDEDMPAGISNEVLDEVNELIGELEEHLADNRRGEILREGVSIAIIGAPNAGKSSLLNAIAARDVAIVSSTAGTTRDVIEVHLDLGGYPVILADTAGLRAATDDQIEAEGIQRATMRAENADLKIAVFDLEKYPDKDDQTAALIDDKTITVFNKQDIVDKKTQEPGGYTVSAALGTGIADFLKGLEKRVASIFDDASGPALTRERHRSHLTQCLSLLRQSLKADLPELAAEDIRLAMRALGRITGRVDVEDLLDVVFRDFCIGK